MLSEDVGFEESASVLVVLVLVPMLLVRLSGCWLMMLLTANLNLGGDWSLAVDVEGLDVSETRA